MLTLAVPRLAKRGPALASHRPTVVPTVSVVEPSVCVVHNACGCTVVVAVVVVVGGFVVVVVADAERRASFALTNPNRCVCVSACRCCLRFVRLVRPSDNQFTLTTIRPAPAFFYVGRESSGGVLSQEFATAGSSTLTSATDTALLDSGCEVRSGTLYCFVVRSIDGTADGNQNPDLSTEYFLLYGSGLEADGGIGE